MQFRKSLLLGASVLACAASIAPQLSHAGALGEIPVERWAMAIMASANKTAGLIDTAQSEMAKTQEVTVRNQYSSARKFYWTAAGCAGIANGVTFVCKSEEVPPNGEARYRFKGGTSQRHVEVKSVDGKDKSCHYKFDVNKTHAINDMTVPFACVGVAQPPQVVPPPPLPKPVISVNISSQRTQPVTVIIGHKYCHVSYHSMSGVCAVAFLNANGSEAISYSVLVPNTGNGESYYLREGGIVMWMDGTTTSQTAAIGSSKSIVIPATGDSVSVR